MSCNCNDQGKCQSAEPSAVDRLVAWWMERRDRRRRLDEIANLPPDELARIARESGIASRDLCELAAMPEGLPVLLQKRLEALGIDDEVRMHQSSLLVADLALSCGRCPDKKTCAADLAIDATDPKWRDYCPNAETLVSIKG